MFASRAKTDHIEYTHFVPHNDYNIKENLKIQKKAGKIIQEKHAQLKIVHIK